MDKLKFGYHYRQAIRSGLNKRTACSTALSWACPTSDEYWAVTKKCSDRWDELDRKTGVGRYTPVPVKVKPTSRRKK